jgi:hypothetical protein
MPTHAIELHEWGARPDDRILECERAKLGTRITADSSAVLRNDNKRAGNGKNNRKSEMRGFFASLRMTTFETRMMSGAGDILFG